MTFGAFYFIKMARVCSNPAKPIMNNNPKPFKGILKKGIDLERGEKVYGLVNQALADFVSKYHNQESWQRIKTEANIQNASFIKTEGYDDAITYRIVGAACKTLEMEAGDFLQAFGRFWVLETAPSAYADLLDSSGNTFAEFMNHLPDLHSRILLVLPNLNPPDFQVRVEAPNQLSLFYQSHRAGLQHFVIGLIYGLGKRFDVEVNVEWKTQTKTDDEPDIFHITWK